MGTVEENCGVQGNNNWTFLKKGGMDHTQSALQILGTYAAQYWKTKEEFVETCVHNIEFLGILHSYYGLKYFMLRGLWGYSKALQGALGKSLKTQKEASL